MKRLSLILFCIMILFTLSGCNSKNTEVINNGYDKSVIVIGCDNYSPFSYADANGEMTGIDVELATEAFSRMGYSVRFEFINWGDKKSLLENGEIDCIWSSFTMSGREDEYNWAGPYMKSNQVIAVNEDSDIYTFDDLEGKVIAVQSTTKPEDIIRSHDGTLPEFRKVISVQKRDLIFILLSKGYVDALAAHDTSVNQFMSDTGLSFRILDKPLQSVDLGVAFSKNDNRGLDKELTDTLVKMQQQGITEQIISRYMADATKYLED